MGKKDLSIHYVCTYEEALSLVKSRKKFWISNCGCRERKGHCSQSRMDVCLYFNDDFPTSGSGKRKISISEVRNLLVEAREHNLVARPFRNENFTGTDGICFCCNDCCEYFLNPSEKCDKGAFIEKTDLEKCSYCGLCEETCYFHARKIKNVKLIIKRGLCYGCGLCLTVCPDNCIEMIKRPD